MDNDKRAVKPSSAVDYEGLVLHRETNGTINVQHHYTPAEAIEIGRALIAVGSKMVSEQSGDINDEDHRRMWLGDEGIGS